MPGNNSSPQDKQWRRIQIDGTKAEVKAELDAIAVAQGDTAKLKHAVALSKGLMNNPSSQAQLKCFVCIVSAILQNARLQILKPALVAKLVQVANGILKLQGIKPQQSRLAFLYGELHLALSQNSRGEGRQWLSAWQLQLAEHFSKSNTSSQNGAHDFALATRLSRLGHVDLAMSLYRRGMASGLSGPALEGALLQTLRGLRLAHQHAEAQQFGLILNERGDLTKAARLDLQWEMSCLKVTKEGSLEVIWQLVQRRRPHYKAAFLLETWLWSACFESANFIERIPKPANLSRNKNLQAQKQGYFLEVVTSLEKLTDTAIPYGYRLMTVGKKLDHLEKMLTIDKVLLTWGALSRILARNGSFSFAILALAQYRALSIQLTSGQSTDALGLLADLYERPWYREYLSNHSPSDVSKLNFLAIAG